MRKLAITSLLLALVPAATAGGRPAKDLPSVEIILQRMRLHDDWQRQHLLEYQVERTFHASNPRFNLQSTLEVRTVFRKPDTFDSEVLRSDGSELIRERVFNKILEAEDVARKESIRTAITADNYTFTLLAQENCDGRACYRLKIASKRKEK